jgi:hypothetical protein
MRGPTSAQDVVGARNMVGARSMVGAWRIVGARRIVRACRKALMSAQPGNGSKRPFPLDPALMTRREALLRVGSLLGSTAFIGQAALLSGCATGSLLREGGAADAFTADEIAWLAEVADTILPATATPGAKAAGVGPFMAVMVRDTYETAEQVTFRAGMRALEEACLALHGVGFMDASRAERTALLERLDAEQMNYMQRRAPGAQAHYFRMMKELTLMGYFTSEIGCTQAQRYMETPGRFDPCVPYTPGEKSWAGHA